MEGAGDCLGLDQQREGPAGIGRCHCCGQVNPNLRLWKGPVDGASDYLSLVQQRLGPVRISQRHDYRH
jgi:hypothetical protein